MSEQGGIEDNATRAYKAHYPRMLMVNHFSSRAPFTVFPSSAMILLVVWSANGNGIVLLVTSKASSKVNLLSELTDGLTPAPITLPHSCCACGVIKITETVGIML